MDEHLIARARFTKINGRRVALITCSCNEVIEGLEKEINNLFGSHRKANGHRMISLSRSARGNPK